MTLNTTARTPGLLRTPHGFPATPDVYHFMQERQFRTYDGLIAILLCFCLAIGLPGNCIALRYFIQTRNRHLSTHLYIAACSIDIVSSVIHLLVTANLLNGRDPGLLANGVYCKVWYFTLLSLQLMSMFVLMLQSLSRALAIQFPFYKIKKKIFLMSIPVALLYYSVWNVLYFFNSAHFHYSYGFGYCDVYWEKGASFVFETMNQINYDACTGIPPVIVFGAMITAIAKLRTQNLSPVSQRHNRRASLTIIYFAALFLTCNLLTFLNNALYTYTRMTESAYPGRIYENQFMFFYSWLISEICCTVLNASLNPILYVCRMRAMREWGMRLFQIDYFDRTQQYNPT